MQLKVKFFASLAEQIGLTETTGFTRLAVTGPGAAAFLDRLTASRLPSVGRIGFGYFCSERGSLVSEATIAA